MPTPRRLQVSCEATPYYHCISRCVRRAFLCGEDRCTNKNFDHRKAWLVDRLHVLVRIFAIDLCAYAVLSNHFHVVVRLDHARSMRWSEEEVILRYGRLFRSAARSTGQSEAERARQVEQWRARLSDLSWFMRCLNESIARRANREDRCTGRFWEGRFRSQALLDEGAVLTCMSYVDLNPIRAGVAATLGSAEFTSVRERLRTRRTRRGNASEPIPRRERSRLLPFEGDDWPEPSVGVEPLPIRFDDYVGLLESVRCSIREGDVARHLPTDLKVVVRRIGLAPDGFISGVREFGRTFFGMVGQAHRIDIESARRGYTRRLGMRAALRLYRPDAA